MSSTFRAAMIVSAFFIPSFSQAVESYPNDYPKGLDDYPEVVACSNDPEPKCLNEFHRLCGKNPSVKCTKKHANDLRKSYVDEPNRSIGKQPHIGQGLDGSKSITVTGSGYNKQLTGYADFRESSEGETFRITPNSNGAVLKSKTTTLYLGISCDAISPQYGEGSWGWANGGFRVEFPKKLIGFPRQPDPLDGKYCPF